MTLEELHLHRLLVAHDGSANADLALRAAITAARRDHAAITLIAVAPDTSTDLSRWAVAAGIPPASQEEVDAEAAAILRAAVEKVPQDIPVKTIVRRGKPGPEIIAQARECGEYDAILLGARGVGRVGALMGSVSAHVLHHADVAVFVAHAPRVREGDGEDQGSTDSAPATATP
jgi:nucleotide-binding universal stress UspA family protein